MALLKFLLGMILISTWYDPYLKGTRGLYRATLHRVQQRNNVTQDRYFVLHWTKLHYTVLYCTTLYYTVLYCITLYYTVMRCTCTNCMPLHHYTTSGCLCRTFSTRPSTRRWPQSMTLWVRWIKLWWDSAGRWLLVMAKVSITYHVLLSWIGPTHSVYVCKISQNMRRRRSENQEITLVFWTEGFLCEAT